LHKLAVTIVDPLSLYQADGGAKGATDLEGGSCLSYAYLQPAWVTAGQVNDNKLARIFGEAGGVLEQGGQL